MPISSTNGIAAVTVSGQTRKASCPPGCKRCNIGGDNSIVCQKALKGYIFDSSGNIVRCANSCKTCSPQNTSLCTSCFRGSKLVGSTCSNCVDPQAITCSGTTGAWSNSCNKGYTPVNGVCTACAENCLSCSIRGAGKCDDGGCGFGYVVITGTTNCTQCFAGCATCGNRSPK